MRGCSGGACAALRAVAGLTARVFLAPLICGNHSAAITGVDDKCLPARVLAALQCDALELLKNLLLPGHHFHAAAAIR